MALYVLKKTMYPASMLPFLSSSLPSRQIYSSFPCSCAAQHLCQATFSLASQKNCASLFRKMVTFAVDDKVSSKSNVSKIIP